MSDVKTCPECGRTFAPTIGATIQVFCSGRCQARYSVKHGPYNRPSITFICAKCGRTVVTEGGRDARTRFCSPECEKKYWRHPPHEHESSRQNFRSIEEYERWERRTNEAT